MPLPTTDPTQVRVVYRARGVAVPAAALTGADVTTINTRLTDLEAGQNLDDLNDVSTAGVVTGHALIYDSSLSPPWRTGSAAGSLARVSNNGVLAEADVIEINFYNGILVEVGTAGDGKINVLPVYGGTGSATTISRSDHTHTLDSTTRTTTAPSGYLSSGSRSLGSVSPTLLNGIEYLVEAELYGQLRGADPGTNNYTLTIDINGNARTSPGGSDGFWVVQGVPKDIKWEHAQTITGTGTAITVSASVAYHSGGGFNVDRTWLKVTLRPRR